MADLTVTATNVDPKQASQGQGTAGVQIDAGELVYKDTADQNKYKLADASAQATSILAGVASNSAGANQPFSFVKDGAFNPGATSAKGTIYVLSTNAGKIATSTDLASTNYVSIVGVGTATNELTVRLQNSQIQVP